ncbi:MAG: permease [Anaerolineales bacterium]|jgi:uncharacterized membrane protein YraQ (UPF0718 family)
MIIATGTLGMLALVMAAYAWRRNDGSLRRGVDAGWLTLKRNLPLLLLAFAIVGYVNVLSPTDLIETLIGPHSGWLGLVIADGVGLLLPGGPYVVFPLIAVLYKAGAGVGPTITLVTSWAMLGLISVAFELPFMGWRFTAVRWGLGLGFPVLVGAVVRILFG